jgi:hypothetical protein
VPGMRLWTAAGMCEPVRICRPVMDFQIIGER